MFDRFTEEAKRVMSFARKASQRLDHEYIGTEHILLGLVEEENAAGEVLRSVGVDPSQVPIAIDRILKRGKRGVTMGQLPFTPRGKKVLEFTMEAAGNLSHIGVQHLLIGLIREREGIAAQVLLHLGATLDSVTAEVARRWPEESRSSGPIEPVQSTGLYFAMDGAIGTARELGDAQVEVPHLLLYSLDHEQSFWSRLCARLNLDPSDVREAIHLALREDDDSQ